MMKRVLTVVLSVVLLCSFLQTGLAEGETPQPAGAPQTTETPQPSEEPSETPQPTVVSEPEPEPTALPTAEPATEPEPTTAAGTVMQPASDDTTPPMLTGVTLNKTDFNAGDTMVINVLCSDLEKGLNPYKCTVMIDVCEIGVLSRMFTINTFVAVDGGIEAHYTFGNTFLAGTYHIEFITLWDNNDIYKCYNVYAGDFAETMFTVHNDYVPPAKPVITYFGVNQKTARVGDTVTYTITGSDPTGIVAAGLEFFAPGIPLYYPKFTVPFSPVAGSPGTFTGSINITADVPEAEYYPFNIYITAGSGVKTVVQWNDLYPQFGYTTVKIINPSLPVNREDAVLLSYSISSHQVIQGQKLDVTLSIDTKSLPIGKIRACLSKKNSSSVSGKNFVNSDMTDQGNGVYTGTITVPLYINSGEFGLSFILFDNGGNGLGLNIPEAFCKYEDNGFRYLKDGDVTILPVITVSGTDNRTIMVGDTFDALQGVTASNAYTGDVTNKMTVVGGALDTSVPGLYLIKYNVNDMITVDGMTSPVSYTDYRWIGVTELASEGLLPTGEMPMALTDGNMAIGAESADVSIKKDGSGIPFSNVVTEPGNYTLTTGGASMAAGAVTNAEGVMEAMSAGGGAQESVTAVIDRSGPAFKAAWQKTGRAGLTVSIKASDISGIAELKFKAGSCGVEDCRANGTAFTGSFGIPGYGLYTVYTRDKLGNESVSVLNINTPASSNSAFLENVYLSGGSLSRAFSRTTTSYKVALGEGEGSFTITPVKDFDDAAMTINGKAVPSYTVNLANGKSAKISVKIRYGRASKTYTFTVTRAKSTNNALSSLGASAGAWSQPFDPNVTNYTLSLDENTKSVNISGAAASPAARASFKTKKITLNNGQSKKVTLTVKAQSGARRTYTITVVRAASSNADLKSLKIKGKGCVLSPSFSAGQTSYTVVMPASAAAVSTVTIYAAPAGYKAKVSVGGTGPSKKVTLAAGQSASVQVAVTSQSGAKKEYTITVTRP